MAEFNLLPRLKASQVNVGKKRRYVDEEGRSYASVTTILKDTQSWASVQALMKWRKRIGEEEAQKISTAAASRGTATHGLVEHYLKGDKLDITEEARPYWESIQPILKDITEVRLIEGPVFHHQLQYAGTVDMVGSYKGVPCIFDWKTADKPKRYMSRLYDYPVQIAAYAGAVNRQYESHGVKIRNGLIVVAVPDMVAETFWMDEEDTMRYWGEWQGRVKDFYLKKAQKKRSSKSKKVAG